MKKCPHCKADLIAHVGGSKDGFFHCNNCGCCFDGLTGDVREGHSACVPVTAIAGSGDEVATLNAQLAEAAAEIQSKNDLLVEQQTAVESAEKLVAAKEEELVKFTSDANEVLAVKDAEIAEKDAEIERLKGEILAAKANSQDSKGK